jgi:hypothetical protein
MFYKHIELLRLFIRNIELITIYLLYHVNLNIDSQK